MVATMSADGDGEATFGMGLKTCGSTHVCFAGGAREQRRHVAEIRRCNKSI